MSFEREPGMSIKPMSPEEVTTYQLESFPPEVIDTVNMLISENFFNGSAVVKQDELLEALQAKGLDRGEIFKRGWLNIEGMYRSIGWKVTYDKPGYNESGRACFIFEVKKKS